MAALQSRGQHHRSRQYVQEHEHEGEEDQVQRGRSSRAGPSLTEESWVLFAPRQPAQPVVSSSADALPDRASATATATATAIPASSTKDGGMPADQRVYSSIDEAAVVPSSLQSDTTIIASDTAHVNRPAGAAVMSASGWQLVDTTSTPSRPSTACAQADPVKSVSAATDSLLEQAAVSVDPLDPFAQPASPLLWSTFPGHDASNFFDDDELVLADGSERPVSSRARASGLPSPESTLQQSVYPAMSGDEGLLHDLDDDTADLLSLPSSLSVSERGSTAAPASSSLASPRMRQPRRRASRASMSPPPSRPHRTAYRDGHLTREALARASLEAERADMAALNVQGSIPLRQARDRARQEDEAGNTSGSEADGEQESWHAAQAIAEEEMLARTPDAMSAGIRAAPRVPFTPLGHGHKTPLQLAGHGTALSACSSQRKRRHRTAGLSDKGSKRSATSSGKLASRLPDTTSNNGPSALVSRHSSVSAPRAGSAFSSFGRKAREIFALDEEVLELLAQPASVFSQPLPPRHRRATMRRASAHSGGLEAFSAHMASELGESPATRYLFTRGLGDGADVTTHGNEEDSGNDSETTLRRSPRARGNRRASFCTRSLQGDITTLAARGDAEDPHTISLGLHRSFSIAGLHHFLVDSVYGHANDRDTGSGSASGAHFNADLREWEARHRTRSHPGGAAGPSLERSHSSSELAERGRPSASSAPSEAATAMQPRSGDGYFQTVSYWRRVLQSIVM